MSREQQLESILRPKNPDKIFISIRAWKSQDTAPRVIPCPGRTYWISNSNHYSHYSYQSDDRLHALSLCTFPSLKNTRMSCHDFCKCMSSALLIRPFLYAVVAIPFRCLSLVFALQGKDGDHTISLWCNFQSYTL